MAVGKKTGGGSRKGKPNKATAQLKEMVLKALEDEGGVQYLRWASREQPASFLTLLGKILPTQVTGEEGGAIIVKWSDSDGEG